MEPNTHSTDPVNELRAIEAAIDELVAEDLAGPPDRALAERLLVLRKLTDLLEAQWVLELAWMDSQAAAEARTRTAERHS